MPQVRVLGKGARITGGICCLLFALHTWIWVLRDIAELGFDGTVKVWTGALGASAGGLTDIPATTADDLGLGLLQLAAAFAAFTGAWTAGGLMAVTTALTFAYRLPVIWHAGLHSEAAPYYALRGFVNDPSVDAAWAGAIGAVLFCTVLGTVLMTGNRPWTGQSAPSAQPGPPAQPYGQHPQFPPSPQFPQPQSQPQSQPQPPSQLQPQPYEPPLPSESPQRPTKAHAAVAAVFSGVMALFSIGWSVLALSTAGGGYWLRLLTGEGTVFTLLDVSQMWALLTLIFVAGTAGILALTRTLSARGFSLGLAIVLLPQAVVSLSAGIYAGTFFELGGAAPVSSALSRLQLLIMLAGAVTLIVLTLRTGIPAQPGPAPVAGAAPPFGAPAGHGQAPAQPYFPPQPGAVPGPVPGAVPGPGPGPGALGPAPNSGPAYAYPPAQPAGPPPPAVPPPGTPPPPAAPPSQGGTGGGPGGTFGPPPAY